MKTPRTILTLMAGVLVLAAGLLPGGAPAAASPTPRPYELWVVDADGSDPRALLLPAEQFDFSMSSDKPTWSPSGSEIAVGGRTLRVVPTAGGEPRVVADLYSSSPVWSPDGAWIAFGASMSTEQGLFLVRPDGTELHHLGPNAHAILPQWSPDGTKIAFATATAPEQSFAVSVVDLQGNVTVLASDWGSGPVTWAPDSQRVTYADKNQTLTIVTLGGVTEKITAAGATHIASWSPDGTKIAITASDALAVVNPDGSGRVDLGQYGSSPDWNATSTAIAYGGSDIFSIPTDGSPAVNLTMTPDRYDTTPEWSPDGTQIAYVSAPKPYIPPDETRTRTLTLNARRSVLKGRLTSDYSYCATDTDVQVQRRRPTGWVSIATVTTGADGRYRTDIGRRFGRFRALVAANEAPSVAGNKITCTEARSPVVRIAR